MSNQALSGGQRLRPPTRRGGWRVESCFGGSAGLALDPLLVLSIHVKRTPFFFEATCLAAPLATLPLRRPFLPGSIIRERSPPGWALGGPGSSSRAADAPSKCGPAAPGRWRGRGASASRPSGRPWAASPWRRAHAMLNTAAGEGVAPPPSIPCFSRRSRSSGRAHPPPRCCGRRWHGRGHGADGGAYSLGGCFRALAHLGRTRFHYRGFGTRQHRLIMQSSCIGCLSCTVDPSYSCWSYWCQDWMDFVRCTDSQDVSCWWDWATPRPS